MSIFNWQHTYTSLPENLFTATLPAPVAKPTTIIYNNTLAKELGIDFKNETAIASVLSGNTVLEGATPIAQAYAGHQFGHFNILGDGRAILLGEHQTPNGQLIDIQLKGAGATPYSRRGDGRATLSSMLREYIISEAMHHLGIPSTRSLAVVASGQPVYRQTVAVGAVLTRLASSHIRVGTFEYAQKIGGVDTLEALCNYTLERHFTNINPTKNKALQLLENVIARQAKLITEWLRVGFIHGVMNTDNMSICGETIDYGPCAFMNIYNQNTVYSSIDTDGRYAYGNQPSIGHWNLCRFAESLLPLLHEQQEEAIKMATDALDVYNDLFTDNYKKMIVAKIGLVESNEVNLELAMRLLKIMQDYALDYTNTFNYLLYPELFVNKEFENSALQAWKENWYNAIGAIENKIPDPVKLLMQKTNPIYIPRNARVEALLNDASISGDASAIKKYLSILEQPYTLLADAYEEIFMWVRDEEEYCTYCGT